MNSLDQFTSYYHETPWLGLIRYIEKIQFELVRDLCIPPILDLGCGDGFVAKQYFNKQLFGGLDIDKKPLKKASMTGSYQTILNADASNLPFYDDSFRTVFSNGAMEHMKDLESVLRELSRILIRGGTLIILVPSDKFLKPVGKISEFFGSMVWRQFNNLHNHVNLFSPEQWYRCMSDHGFNVKFIKSYGAYKIAKTISLYDLLSKFHLRQQWPFLQLKHNGNIGRFVLKILMSHSLYMLAKYEHIDMGLDGYWLLIVAINCL